MNKDILVSICCTTYNHERYIHKAINGFLMQETNFNYEIIIHDDASTDRTQQIILEYAAKDDRIKPILRKTNLKSTGVLVTPKALHKATGKYIALCEGDDYWIDSKKLQKQVNFLESHKEYSLCFHDVVVLWEDKGTNPSLFCPPELPETLSIEDIISGWNIPTTSMVFRSEVLLPLPDWFYNIYNGDLAIQLILADKGKTKYFNEIMGVYWRSPGSLSYGIGRNPIFVSQRKIELFEQFDIHSNFQYSKQINMMISKVKKQMVIVEYKYKNEFNLAIFKFWNILKAKIKCIG